MSYNPYMNNNPYNNYNMYNPYNNPVQNRINTLNQQKQDIEAQINMLQGQTQQTPIVQNFQLNPQNQNYDFNGSFIEKEEDAKNFNISDNKPLFLMNKNKNEFYIKNVDGTVQTFSFEQVIENNNANSNSETIAPNEDLKEVKESITSILAILDVMNQNFNGMAQILGNMQNDVQNQTETHLESVKEVKHDNNKNKKRFFKDKDVIDNE